MRSFLKLAVLASIFWVFITPAQAEINLFIVEKPLESYKDGEVDSLLSEAAHNLLIRLTGGDSVLELEEAQKYIKQPKRWISSYHFENSEVDGVVIGQKLVVSFDKSRLLAEFQQDDIHIWPLRNRPKTLMVGNFNQQGLLANLSLESLQYRLDMDYRDFSSLVGLEVDIPQKNRDYGSLGLARLSQASSLQEITSADFSDYDYLFVALAKSKNNGVEINFKTFSIKNGQSIYSFTKQNSSYLSSLQDGFLELLTFYSAPYREGVEDFGIIQLEVENLTSFKKYSLINNYLHSLKPSMREVKLIKLEGSKASYELFYQGSYADLVSLINSGSNLDIVDESRFTGTIFTKALP